MKKLVLLLMITSLVGSVNAAVYRYAGSGPWEDAARWTPDNGTTYPGVLPGSADEARMNWGDNTVTVSSAVPEVDQCLAGVDESGNLHVLSGGVVTTVDWSGAGVAGVCTGTFLIDAGGTMDFGSHLLVGVGPVGNVGLVDISGVVNVGGMLLIGTSDGINPSGGTGTVIVREGGVLNLRDFGPIRPIQPGSLLNVHAGGLATLPGDFVNLIQGYIDDGYISGAVVPVYDDFGAIIQTNIVPEPATMILLGLGAILLRRKIKEYNL